MNVPNILLPANTPPGSLLGLGTEVQNAGAGAPNAPTANAPGPAQFQPAQAAGLYQIPPPPANSQGPIQLPLPASGNPGPSGSAGQNIRPLPMRPLKLQLDLSASTHKMSGAASANNPQLMFPQVVMNNHPLNNPPQTAGGSNQIQAGPPNPQWPNQPRSTASANAGPSANQIQPVQANPQGVYQPPSMVSAGPGPSGSPKQNNPLQVIAPAILRLGSWGVRMPKISAPLVNNPSENPTSCPLNYSWYSCAGQS